MPVILFHAVNHSKQMGHSYGCTLLSHGLMGYQSLGLLRIWEANDCAVAGLQITSSFYFNSLLNMVRE